MRNPTWEPPAGDYHDLGLRVRVAGNGPPTVLLLHGLAGSNRYYGAAFDALAAEARVVVPDLLGFGQSPRPTGVAYDADHHARAVVRALDQLGIEGPIFVVGHSVGSLVALRIATLRPAQVRGVLALGPPIYPDRESARSHLSELGAMSRMFLLDSAVARAACAVMCLFRGASARIATWLRPDLPEPLARDGVQHHWQSYSGTLREVILEAQPPPDLEQLRAPLWLIAGADDSVLDRAFLEAVARRDGIQLEVWSGGHDLPLDDPARCVATLRRMIATTAAGAATASASAQP